jgi:UDP-N-acetylmuramoyl-tripeptide--D-alanyl-D-alanine ligase
MMQQNGYKTNEYRSWMNQNFSRTVITTEHVLYNVVIFALIWLMSTKVTLTAATVILITFAIFWFGSVSKYKPDREKKPLAFTSRMQRLAITLLVLLAPFWYYTLENSFGSPVWQDTHPLMLADTYFLCFGFVIADMMIPFLVYAAAWIMKPVESQIQRGFKKQARRKIASMPGLKVIAITGSYGKTSTKFMLATLLKERFSVCFTPGSYNTPMGICKVINNDLEAHHQILILEMGARYEGNIKELCEIARPHISVITNVGVAHMESFGSAEAVAREKSTLARELVKDGLLVLNGDDPVVASMAELRNDVKTVFTGDKGSVQAEEISYGTEGTSFKMIWVDGDKKESIQVQTKLLGKHNVDNLLLAAAVARELGIRSGTVALAASTIEPVEHRLELKQRNGIYIIDDAFNSNPVGAKNAVEILAGFTSGRRIIVTPGMIELGELQEEANREFGRDIGKANLDMIYLVGKEQTRPILNGIKETADSDDNIHVVSSLFEANDHLQKSMKPGDVILYENDLPDSFNE